MHSSIFSLQEKQIATTNNYVMPPKENIWCKIQVMPVGNNREDPISSQVIGWDNLNSCCIISVDGYNCALQKEANVKYCFTGNVGGQVLWVNIDGYYGNKDLYKTYVEQQDKYAIESKPCNSSIYPKGIT